MKLNEKIAYDLYQELKANSNVSIRKLTRVLTDLGYRNKFNRPYSWQSVRYYLLRYDPTFIRQHNNNMRKRIMLVQSSLWNKAEAFYQERLSGEFVKITKNSLTLENTYRQLLAGMDIPLQYLVHSNGVYVIIKDNKIITDDDQIDNSCRIQLVKVRYAR